MVCTSITRGWHLALVAGLTLVRADLSAQSTEIGVRAGGASPVVQTVNCVTFTGECNYRYDELIGSARVGAMGGAFVRRHLVGSLSVQPELLLVPKGYYNYAKSRRAVYLEVPLLLRLDGDVGRLGGFLLGGYGLGVELRCRESRQTTEGGTTRDCDDYPGGGTRRTEFIATVGTGVTWQTGKGRWLLDARYGLGTTNIRYGSYRKERNQTALFTLGYAVPFARR